MLFTKDHEKNYTCVIYTRISDLEKSEISPSDTIASQRDICESFIKTRPHWKLLPIRYDDRNYSGGTLDRPALNRLRQEAKQGKFNMIIVKSIDRFSRDLRQFFEVYPELEKYSVHLCCASQTFSTDDATGRLILQVLLSFAEFERQLASERTKDRMRFRAKNGFFHGGSPPLGYDFTKKKGILTINKRETKIVSLIFNKYIEIQSSHRVAVFINSLGYRTKAWTTKTKQKRGGNKFTESIILNTLKKVTYIANTKADKELFPAQWKPIISERVFARVQKLIANNAQTKTSISENKYKLLLTGLIWCDYCKSQMTANHSLKTKNGKKIAYLYYKCTKVDHSDKTACAIRSVPARELENLIIERIKMLSQNREITDTVIKSANKISKNRLPELIKTRNELFGDLTKIKNEAQPLITALQTKKLSLVQDKLEKLEETKTTLENRLQQLEYEIDREKLKTVNPDLVAQNLTTFRTVFERLSFEKKYQLLHLLIKEIIYQKNHSQIKIKFYDLPEIKMPPERPKKGNSGGTSSRFDERMNWLPL